MPCKRCQSADDSNLASPRKCAFENSEFSGDNWNCETINEFIRQVILRDEECHVDNTRYGFDETLRFLLCPETIGGWIVATWYKQRGKCSTMLHISSEGARPMLLSTLEETLRL